MKNSLEGANFLKKKYNLHQSEEVQSAKKRTEKREEEKVSQKPEAQIDNYLDRFREILDREDEVKRERGIEALKKVIHDKYIIKAENVPERTFELEQDIAEEQGHGRPDITEEFRERKITNIISDQEKSLDRWIDYLSSTDEAEVPYPDWLRYWAIRSVLSMGKFNKEEAKFENRSKDTVAPFPPLNSRALGEVLDLVKKKVGKESVGVDNEDLEKLIKEENFSKIYAYILKNIPEFTEEGLENIRGEWIKYKQGEDHTPLVESLEGYPLEWCTAADDTAKTQLEAGDFYVYYSENNHGENKIPRLAIRMNGKNKIGEIRGITNNQNIDQYIQPVLEEKLDEFGQEGEAYKEKSADMKRMTEITKKHRKGEELEKDDLRFLYKIDKKIKGFGYQEDPRIREVLMGRDTRNDLAKILKLPKDKISLNNKEALSGDIVFHYDKLELNDLKISKGLKLPESVGGGLELDGLKSAKELKFPESVGGYLNLSGLTSAKELKLPESVGGDLYLNGLTSAEGLKLPESVGGGLELSGLTNAEGIKFPESVGGDLYLSGLTSAEGLKLPESVGRDLYLNGLTSVEKDMLRIKYPNLASKIR